MSNESGLPSQLDPRNRQQTGIEVLDHGLPPLPDFLTHQMSIPLALWKATDCAVVLFLAYFRQADDGKFTPSVTMGTYSRQEDRWAANKWWTGKGWGHDPITDPSDLRDLAGRAIVSSGGSQSPDPRPGYPASVVTGRVSPAVTHLALIHDGREERRKLQSHLGAWVVCTDKWLPYQLNALDENGAVLGSISAPARVPGGPEQTSR